MRKKQTGTIVALVVILVAGVVLYFAYTGDGNSNSYTEAPSTTADEGAGNSVTTTAQPLEDQTQENTTATTTAANAAWVYPFSFPGFDAPVLAYIPSDFYLILVNRFHALPCDFTRDFLRLENAGNGVLMHATAARYFRDMYAAGREAGVTLTPISGYRDTQRQETNFRNRIQRYRNEGHSYEIAVDMAARWIKPPRCSEHETGLAMDIGNLHQNMENSNEFRWLMENAHNFGFILRYPRGAEHITYVNYEPWHWRFVGVENATAIRASGLVLEQWLEQR